MSSSNNLSTNRIDREKLVHMLYEAVVDNSLWPEMVSELLEHIDSSRVNHAADSKYLSDLTKHFERAFQLSECIVDLQEQNSTLAGVLDGLSLGISLYDHSDQLIYANEFATSSGIVLNKPMLRLKEETKALKTSTSAQTATDKSGDVCVLRDDTDLHDVAIVPVKQIKTLSLPKNIATLVIHSPKQSKATLSYLRQTYYLTQSEADFLEAFYQLRNLKAAATARGLTYESARTYLKRLFLKTGSNDQNSLLNLIESNPLSFIQIVDNQLHQTDSVRCNLKLEDGRNLEYFSLGPESGHVILHFDALSGVAIDILGQPNRYLPILNELNLRIITPCRPGTFRSSPKRMHGLSEWTDDLLALCDAIHADKVTLLSQAFGSGSALAFAATAQTRVKNAVLCAPSYPNYEPENWRQMDLFYIISGVIGRRAPRLMQAIVPFLMRSVMQNTRKYLNRHIVRSHCQADIDVLSSETLQKRIPEMLGERTALGYEGLVQENYLNTHGWDFSLQSIRCPVRILQGGQDNVSDPQGSAELARRIPNAQLHLFAELGQYMLFSQWPWILELCQEKEPAELQQSDPALTAEYADSTC